MDSRPIAAVSTHFYRQPGQQTPASFASSSSLVDSDTPVQPAAPFHISSPSVHLLPIDFPQQSHLYHAQLLQYNKLISPVRGGGVSGSHSSPHVKTASATYTQTQTAKTRSRSSSKVSNKDHPNSRPGAQNCHGNKTSKKPTDTADRAFTGPAEKDKPHSKMPANAKKQPERSPKQTHSKASPATNGASRPAAPNSLAEPAALSSSVPSTPHQRPRKFSFDGSREPSPGTNQNHSPRSVYSETNSTLPSLRPLPPRLTGCRLEVAPPTARRRMNYSIGTDKLDKVDPEKIKSELSEHEEQKLTRDMRELYDRLLPSSESERNRLKLVKKLERIFNDEWPGHDIQVHLFGSSGNLLCSDDSDGLFYLSTPCRHGAQD